MYKRQVVWFENDQSYQEKLGLIEKYNLKGAGAWSLGQEEPSIWDHYEDWINGSDSGSEDSPSTTPSQPEQPEESTPPTEGTESQPSEEAEFKTAYVKRNQTSVSVYPVSYTHLDVYKRQVHKMADWFPTTISAIP